MSKLTATPTGEMPSASLRSLRVESALGVLLERDEVSRTELAVATGYSRPSVTATVRDLLNAGLVHECGMDESTGGRRRTLLRLNRSAVHLSMVAAEPTDLIFRQLDLQGQVHAELHRTLTSEDALRQVATGLSELHQLAPFSSRCAVVALPGVVSSDGTVSNSPFLPIERTTRLRGALESRFKFPVMVENDVNLLALGEYTQGSAKGHDDFALIYVGEGVGATIVTGGRPHLGATGSAGEIGFLPWGLRRPSPVGVGPLEAEWSSRAMIAKARNLGISAPPEEVCRALADSSSPAAWGLLRSAIDAWAYAATVIACVVDPSLVVFAGMAAELPSDARHLLEAQVTASVPTEVNVSFAELGHRALTAGVIARIQSSPHVLFGGDNDPSHSEE